MKTFDITIWSYRLNWYVVYTRKCMRNTAYRMHVWNLYVCHVIPICISYECHIKPICAITQVQQLPTKGRGSHEAHGKEVTQVPTQDNTHACHANNMQCIPVLRYRYTHSFIWCYIGSSHWLRGPFMVLSSCDVYDPSVVLDLSLVRGSYLLAFEGNF